MSRLRDFGIPCSPLVEYSNEIRRWTVLLFPNTENILMTCYKNNPGDFWFKLSCKSCDMKIKTMSIMVILKQLEQILDNSPKKEDKAV
jgi:hypothetical protein